MKTSVLLALAFASLHTAHALDLTPIQSFRILEKMKIPVISFDDGKRKVNWQPPAGWQLSGGDNQLNVYPEKIPLAAMQLRILPNAAAQVPDPTTAQDELFKWALAFLPGDTTNLTFDHEAPSPFLLDNLHSRELTFNYVSAARKCSTSVALVTLDELQSFALVITARAEDFQVVHNTGTKSMFRWSWAPKLLPGQGETASLR